MENAVGVVEAEFTKSSVMNRQEPCFEVSTVKYCIWVHVIVVKPHWHSSLTAVGKFCRQSGRTVRLGWHCIATAVRELCHWSGKTVRRQWENFPAACIMYLSSFVHRISSFRVTLHPPKLFYGTKKGLLCKKI